MAVPVLGEIVYNKTANTIHIGDGSTAAANLKAVKGGYEGNLNSLTTTQKSNLVGAINEVNSYVDYFRNYTSGAGHHNSLFRGKNLGTSLTSAQSSAIRAGTFNDIDVGDYWVIDSVTWRVAHCDYFYNFGDTACTTHHVVVVPDSNLYNARMNATNTTTGGYVGSEMRTANLETAKTRINSCFGEDHVLKHREALTNSVTNGVIDVYNASPAGFIWTDSTVELMSERMVYGSACFGPVVFDPTASLPPSLYTVAWGQLALFALRKDLACNRSWYWLRDVVSATHFANVSSNGNCARIANS